MLLLSVLSGSCNVASVSVPSGRSRCWLGCVEDGGRRASRAGSGPGEILYLFSLETGA